LWKHAVTWTTAARITVVSKQLLAAGVTPCVLQWVTAVRMLAKSVKSVQTQTVAWVSALMNSWKALHVNATLVVSSVMIVVRTPVTSVVLAMTPSIPATFLTLVRREQQTFRNVVSAVSKREVAEMTVSMVSGVNVSAKKNVRRAHRFHVERDVVFRFAH